MRILRSKCNKGVKVDKDITSKDIEEQKDCGLLRSKLRIAQSVKVWRSNWDYIRMSMEIFLVREDCLILRYHEPQSTLCCYHKRES